MTITVFTPTYNRAGLLQYLYNSLCAQTFKDFEWLIVDDGSTDNTEEVVQSFIAEHKFETVYFKKQNGGKHTAVNYGVRQAKGELFFIVDSDDKLPKNALELVDEYYQPIKDNQEFAGVCGLKAYFDGDLLPGVIDYDVLDSNGMDYSYRRGNSPCGDIAEIIVKTEIMKQYPFPEFEGENFCAESAIWDPIRDKYKFRYFNKIIYLCEFLEDGLSANSLRSRMRCPLSSMYIYSRLCKYDVPISIKLKSAINYWRFYFCNSKKRYPKISKIYYFLIIFGFFMHIMDKKKSVNRLKIGKERYE